MGLPLQFCCDLQIYAELNLHQRKPWQREEAADMRRRHATKCLLLCRWVGKKSLRNFENYSLKNDRCLIISHKLETFLWKQLKTNCPNQPVQRLQFELYFWVFLHMHKYLLVWTSLTTFPSPSMEHIVLPISDWGTLTDQMYLMPFLQNHLGCRQIKLMPSKPSIVYSKVCSFKDKNLGLLT